MSRAADGTYTLPSNTVTGPGKPVTGTPISNPDFATTMSDIEAALTDSLSRSGKGGLNTPMQFANGSAGTPSITFTTETTTGFFHSAGLIGMAILGAVKASLTATLARFYTPVQMDSTASIAGAATVGGTLGVTGEITCAAKVTAEGFDAGTNTIDNVVDPTTDQQAATKKYVDAQVYGTGNTTINNSYIPNGSKVSWDGVNYTVAGTGVSGLAILAGSHIGAYEGVCGFSITGTYTVRGVVASAKGSVVPTIYLPGDLDPYTSSVIPANQFYIQWSISSSGAGANPTYYSMMFWYTV